MGSLAALLLPGFAEFGLGWFNQYLRAKGQAPMTPDEQAAFLGTTKAHFNAVADTFEAHVIAGRLAKDAVEAGRKAAQEAGHSTSDEAPEGSDHDG